jgi:hypothetical protein
MSEVLKRLARNPDAKDLFVLMGDTHRAMNEAYDCCVKLNQVLRPGCTRN